MLCGGRHRRVERGGELEVHVPRTRPRAERNCDENRQSQQRPCTKIVTAKNPEESGAISSLELPVRPSSAGWSSIQFSAEFMFANCRSARTADNTRKFSRSGAQQLLPRWTGARMKSADALLRASPGLQKARSLAHAGRT